MKEFIISNPVGTTFCFRFRSHNYSDRSCTSASLKAQTNWEAATLMHRSFFWNYSMLRW
jgi:hypothetical protein